MCYGHKLVFFLSAPSLVGQEKGALVGVIGGTTIFADPHISSFLDYVEEEEPLIANLWNVVAQTVNERCSRIERPYWNFDS